jgi:hypothetical protein
MPTEKDLQKKINADLKKLGIRYYHCEKGRYNKSLQHRAGWPDLVVLPCMGYAFFVELKMPGQKLKKEQTDFKNWCNDMKYNYYIVHNMAEWDLIKNIEEIHKR